MKAQDSSLGRNASRQRKATQREQLKDKQASSKREQPLQQELIKIKRRKVTSKI